MHSCSLLCNKPSFCLLTYWRTFVEPSTLITDLKKKFHDTKKDEVKQNILNLFHDWIKLDPIMFEQEEGLWSVALSPWLLSLYNSKWKNRAHLIGVDFMAPFLGVLWDGGWKLICCGLLFDKGFSLGFVPRDVFLLLVNYCIRFQQQLVGKRQSDLSQRLQRTAQVKKKKDKEPKQKQAKGPAPGFILDFEPKVIAEQLTIKDISITTQCSPHSIFCFACKKNPRFGSTVVAMVCSFKSPCC